MFNSSDNCKYIDLIPATRPSGYLTPTLLRPIALLRLNKVLNLEKPSRGETCEAAY